MENLDKALAELAEQLGISANELVSWMTGGGLRSYADMMILHNATAGLGYLLLAILCAVIAWRSHQFNKGKEWHEQSEGVAVLLWISAMGSALSLIGSYCLFKTALLWYVTPQGMIIDAFMTLLRYR